MNRRNLLKSTMIAGAGVLLTGNAVSAAILNADNTGEAVSQNSGSAFFYWKIPKEKVIAQKTFRP